MFNRFITSPESLVTTREQTRAGFLITALEKNRVGDQFVGEVLAFKANCSGAACPGDLLHIPQIRPFLLAAAGLSDKALKILTPADQDQALAELVDHYLIPAGNDFIDEAIKRYLLAKGDALGGIMRNKIGVLAQEKLIRCILSRLNAQSVPYDWLENTDHAPWKHQTAQDAGIEKNMKALHWENANGHRVLAFNLKIPVVKNNVDICLFHCDTNTFDYGQIVHQTDAAVMMGELKGGFDPAGADEHWKTANSALGRIRDKFHDAGYDIPISFVCGAIAKKMAGEIYRQLESGQISNAANLNNPDQLVEYCNWLIAL